MNTAIVANGDLQDHPRLRDIWRSADLRIAADGGAANARRYLELAPHVLIGDLDSLDDATRLWCEMSHTELMPHPRGKDQTDLELAIDLAIKRHADGISILGALGGRFDQTMANALLLLKPMRARIPARIVGAEVETWIAAERTTLTGRRGDTVSLLPLTERVEGITTQGLRYPLRQETLDLGSPRGVSNELVTERAEVSFARGLLLVVHLHAEA